MYAFFERVLDETEMGFVILGKEIKVSEAGRKGGTQSCATVDGLKAYGKLQFKEAGPKTIRLFSGR